jgi:phage terminase small subunit
MARPDLNPRQRRFVREYLIDLNATQAAIRAGYASKHADVAGSQLLGNPKIKAAVDAQKKRREEKLEIKADDVLRELLRVARSDIAELYDEDGQLKPVHEMPENARRAIAGLEVEEASERHGIIRKVKLWSKPQALEALGKHLKLFTDVVEVSLAPHSELILAAAARAAITKDPPK